mmetsp:Transcript_17165/g.51369  ORF Transcript_17165/g.51369 Transcript_17165/m.51369 type:complete len:453 (-) Transcript_17165:709-2067(-)
MALSHSRQRLALLVLLAFLTAADCTEARRLLLRYISGSYPPQIASAAPHDLLPARPPAVVPASAALPISRASLRSAAVTAGGSTVSGMSRGTSDVTFGTRAPSISSTGETPNPTSATGHRATAPPMLLAVAPTAIAANTMAYVRDEKVDDEIANEAVKKKNKQSTAVTGLIIGLIVGGVVLCSIFAVACVQWCHRYQDRLNIAWRAGVAERAAAVERARVAALPEIPVVEAHMVTNPDGEVIAAVIEGLLPSATSSAENSGRSGGSKVSITIDSVPTEVIVQGLGSCDLELTSITPILPSVTPTSSAPFHRSASDDAAADAGCGSHQRCKQHFPSDDCTCDESLPHAGGGNTCALARSSWRCSASDDENRHGGGDNGGGGGSGSSSDDGGWSSECGGGGSDGGGGSGSLSSSCSESRFLVHEGKKEAVQQLALAAELAAIPACLRDVVGLDD